jgi:hypothetical protein
MKFQIHLNIFRRDADDFYYTYIAYAIISLGFLVVISWHADNQSNAWAEECLTFYIIEVPAELF